MMKALAPLAAAVLLVSCGGTSSDETTTTTVPPTTTTVAVATWEEVASPVVDGSTDPVTTVNGKLVDGLYWAVIGTTSGTGRSVFTVTQVRFGEDCYAWLESGVDPTAACDNDYGVQGEPVAFVELADDAEVSVTSASGPGTNYAIDASTLAGLEDGTATSPVPGYEWQPFPFVLLVENGLAVSAHQMWLP